MAKINFKDVKEGTSFKLSPLETDDRQYLKIHSVTVIVSMKDRLYVNANAVTPRGHLVKLDDNCPVFINR